MGQPMDRTIELQSSLHEADQMRPLNELDFMDIYVRLDAPGIAHYREGLGLGPPSQADLEIPDEYQHDVEDLTDYLRENFTGVEKGFSYKGMRLRASKLETASGQIWAALRRIPDLPPKLDKLGFPAKLVPLLQEFGLRAGLILICGSTGQGKTTTASSLVLEYLKNYGGVAFSIEDPVEYLLEGRRGQIGYCYQSEVHEEKEWSLLLKRSLRWHPRYIFVGEIRTPDAANQLLRAATSGHTVIATMHAGSMEEALEGLLQLAEQELGARAPLLLAAGLITVIYQSFGVTPGLNVNFVATEPDNPGSPVRTLIREKRIGQVRTFSDQQMALLTQTGKIFRDQYDQ